jgi:hypothetical protein
MKKPSSESHETIPLERTPRYEGPGRWRNLASATAALFSIHFQDCISGEPPGCYLDGRRGAPIPCPASPVLLDNLAIQ